MRDIPKESWRQFKNTGSTAMVPYGIGAVTGVDSDGFAQVQEPTIYSPPELLVVNSASLVSVGGIGECHQFYPANVAYDAGRGSTPANGEIWGPQTGTWYLMKCVPGFMIVGGATNGLVSVVPIKRRIKAKITGRTEDTCGNSGSSVRSGTELSGSNATDHNDYTYTLHSVHAVNDGDGCRRFVIDDVDSAIIIEDAIEQNNYAVPINTIVDAELISYTDEFLSGSQASSGSDTDGPVSCRWVFSHEASTQESPSQQDRYRYFCVDGINKEYLEKSDGTLTFLRNNGCCDCTDFGSGSGAPGECALCDPPEDTLCVYIDGTSSQLEYLGCSPPPQIQVEYAGVSGNNQMWTGSTTFGFPIQTWRADLIVTCGQIYGLKVYIEFGVQHLCELSGFVVDDAANCSFPQTLTLSNIYGTGCFGGVNPDCQLPATIAVGACPDETADSGSLGLCPCVWTSTGLGWGFTSSDGSCGGGGPTQGCVSPAGTGTLGQVFYANCDGSACTVEHSISPSCGDCDTSSNRTATWSNQTGCLVGVGGSPMTLTPTTSNGITLWSSSPFSICNFSQTLLYWCEGDRWFLFIRGSGSIVEADAGATCSSMTFHVVLTTANTICPSVPGSATIVITT